MTKNPAPSGASAEVTDLVRQLRALYRRRAAAEDRLHRLPDLDAILLELCGFRGMQYTEAAEILGYTREGVARRVRPLIQPWAKLTPFERGQIKGPVRPLHRAKTEELVASLANPAALKAEAEDDLNQATTELVQVMNQLKAKGVPWHVQAQRLGVSLSTVQRIRGVM